MPAKSERKAVGKGVIAYLEKQQADDGRKYQSINAHPTEKKSSRFGNYSTLSKKNPATFRVSSTNIERSPEGASRPNLQFSNSVNPRRKLKPQSKEDRADRISYPLPNAQSFKPETFKKVNEYLRQVGYVPNSTNSIISIGKINDSRVQFGQSQRSLKSNDGRMRSNDSGQNDGSRQRLPMVEYDQR